MSKTPRTAAPTRPPAYDFVGDVAREVFAPAPPPLSLQAVATAYQIHSRQRAFQLIEKFGIETMSNPDKLLAVLLDKGVSSVLRTKLCDPAQLAEIKRKLEVLTLIAKHEAAIATYRKTL
ncbi:MAG: hypothetical protein WCJ66_17470 [Verrucomicrobiota bacterium]